MTVLPVIERELRAQSRLAFTYHLRVVGAAVLLAVCVFYGLPVALGHALGGILFWRLNCTLFVSIWILVPMLCADCISRERREGTVGLLFLTPLKARDVVLAKGFVHGLRASSLLLAVLPIITIALLLGGVAWSDAALSVIMNFSALCWALAAGLLGSSLSKTWLRSQLLAFAFASGFGFIFLVAAGSNLLWYFGPHWRLSFFVSANIDRLVAIGALGATDFDGWWGKTLATLPRGGQASCVLAQCRMVILSAAFLLLSVEISARNLRRFWREEPPSARQVWLEQKLFTPILLVSFLRGWMRRKLERNPIGWLEQRTWSGRLVTWGWFAVMISIYSAAFNNADVSHSLDILQKFMAWLLLGIVAVSAAGSFQRERETGVLELLLVSPMTVSQIIGGRLRGIWGQFLPAFALLLCIWAFLSNFFPSRQSAHELIAFFCGAFLALPVIGLYYSLRCSNFIMAFLSTLVIALAVPLGLKLVFALGLQFLLGINSFYLRELTASQNDDSLSTLLFYALLRLASLPLFVTLIQLAVAAWVARRLYRDMSRRNFPFSRAVT